MPETAAGESQVLPHIQTRLPSRLPYLLLVLAGAAVAYILGHWHALVNPYVINDDVRQQVYWMQVWRDPELFPDDLLSRYARSYVPWGVQAVYYLASPFANPVACTEIVAGILFVTTAAFLYGLGLAFRDERTAVWIVCVSLFFPATFQKISGGISQSFALPTLVAYLFFLDRGWIRTASWVILLQSLLTPYTFLLCWTTHALFFLHRQGRRLLRGLFHPGERSSGQAGRLLAIHLPLVLGGLLAALYVLTKPDEFGPIVTWADMEGKIEYTAQGRYPILPRPSPLQEVLRPWMSFFPFQELGPAAGWVGVAVVLGVCLLTARAVHRKRGFGSPLLEGIHPAGFRVFGYLLPASLLLYGVSSLLLLRLFLPERYVELPFQVFYCVAAGVALQVSIQTLEGRKARFPLVVFLVMALAGIRCCNSGLIDCSGTAPLCRFLEETTPRDSLLAGHPELMDNVVTFARRKAFVTYELSHTWYTRYWEILRDRTFQWAAALYSHDPQEILDFCRRNHIDTLVVREEDYERERLQRGRIYFEPFNEFIGDVTRPARGFAILDTDLFPPVYRRDGIRVLRIQ